MVSSPTAITLQSVTELRAQLGEGPIWSPDREAVYFVDIEGRHLHRFRPQNAALKTWPTPARPAFVVPTDGAALLVGLEDGLYTFDEAEGTFTCLQPIPATTDPRIRLNDACVDDAGRLWFGTMDEDEKSGKGELFCFKAADHGYDFQVHDRDFIVTNGPTVSPDGRMLYVSDTPRGIIYQHCLSHSGLLSDKKRFATLSDNEGGPDGIVCDRDGYIWVSCWGGSKIIVFNAQGAREMEIPMPCPNITKVVFTGASLSTLFVTSARQGLSDDVLARHPQAGAIFMGETTHVGMPLRAFRLSQLQSS